MERPDIVFTRALAIAPDPRLDRAASCLSAAGYSCLAIGWDREGGNPVAETTPSGYSVKRCGPRSVYGSGLRNLLRLLHFNTRLLLEILTARPRAIHAYDLDTGLAALLASRLLRVPLVYDIADWYADSRTVGPLKRIANRLERFVSARADRVIIVHEARASQVGDVGKPLTVIYNTPEDATVASPSGSEPSCWDKRALGPYVSYVGVLQPDRGIEQVIDAAVSTGTKLVIAGFGPLEGHCARASAASPDIVRFMGRVAYSEALDIQGNSRAIVALYDPAIANNRLAAPNKLYEAMMLGVPLITNRGTTAAETVLLEGMGLAVDYGEPRTLMDAMRAVVASDGLSASQGRRGRAAYDMRYSYSTQCRKLLTIYSDILPSARK